MESQPNAPQPDDRIIAKLLTVLTGKNPDLRRSAARKLGKINHDAVVKGLLPALHHQNSDIQAWAAWTLAEIGTETVVNQLLISLKNQAADVRIWAIWAIGQIQTQTAIKALVKALTHPDSQVRWRAASSLGKIPSKILVPFLLRSLKDPDYYVRGKSAVALGKIGDDTAISALIAALSDREIYVRTQAVEGLGKIRTQTAIIALLKALNHQESSVRAAVVSQLGSINHKTVVSALINSLKDPDVFVRGRVVLGLGEISTDEAINGIKQALTDPELYVRSIAKEILNNIQITHEKISYDPGYFVNSDVPKSDGVMAIISETKSNNIPTILITSYAEASEHLLNKITGSLIKHFISIGSPGVPLPRGYKQVSHRLRLEFHDIDIPLSDPEYVLPTVKDILKVIEFVPLIAQQGGNLLIHCHAGISRSTAVALTVCAVLLGPDKEEEALEIVLTATPHARPNIWIVELADEVLKRKGKLIEVVKRLHERVINDYKSNYQE